MLKKLSVSLLGLLLVFGAVKPSQAESVMEKVSRTGILTVGTRFDLVPYSYVNDKGELDGYSLNMINLIREEIEKQIGKPITVQVVESNNIPDRISKLQTGEIDIACDTAFTWERDKYVDFSVSYGVSGIRVLVPKNSSLGSPESLAGKRVAVLAKTTAADTIKLIQPKAILVTVDTPEDGINQLKGGKVDAVAGDGIILEGLRQKMGLNDYQVVPKAPYARYGVACMVPQNNSTFLNLANYTLVKFMQGYVTGEPGPVELINRWFGPQGVINIDPDIVRDFFTYTIITHEQIPPSK